MKIMRNVCINSQWNLYRKCFHISQAETAAIGDPYRTIVGDSQQKDATGDYVNHCYCFYIENYYN